MTYTENDIKAMMMQDEQNAKKNNKTYSKNISRKYAITMLERADKSDEIDKEKYYYSQPQTCDIEHPSRNISEEEYWQKANALTEKRIKELYGYEEGQTIINAIYYHTHHPELTRKQIATMYGITHHRYYDIMNTLQHDNYLRCIPGMIYGDDSFIWSPTDGRKERRKKSKNNKEST